MWNWIKRVFSKPPKGQHRWAQILKSLICYKGTHLYKVILTCFVKILHNITCRSYNRTVFNNQHSANGCVCTGLPTAAKRSQLVTSTETPSSTASTRLLSTPQIRLEAPNIFILCSFAWKVAFHLLIIFLHTCIVSRCSCVCTFLV